MLKDSLYLEARTHNSYWKMPKQPKYSSWIPKVSFDVYIDRDADAGSWTAEYFNPDGSQWFSETLAAGMYAADRTIRFESDRTATTAVLEKKSTDQTGIYAVKITSKETGETVFQGKFKAGKFLPEFRAKNEYEFFVEHDWMMPVGSVVFHHSAFTDETGGVEILPRVWMKGNVEKDDLEARVFFGGRQIASTKDKASGITDARERKSEFGNLSAALHHWKLWEFMFANLRFANGGGFNRERYAGAHYADENPGEYTIKVFNKGEQVRELKFTVQADGKLSGGDFDRQLFVPNYGVIVPVKILGTSEKWNHAAWKTDAFYGNPLAGFNVP